MKNVIKYKDTFIVRYSRLTGITKEDFTLRGIEFSEKSGIEFLNLTISLQKTKEKSHIKTFTYLFGKRNKDNLLKAIDNLMLVDYCDLLNKRRLSIFKRVIRYMVDEIYDKMLEFEKEKIKQNGM